jgi:hypothetical protein
VQLQRSKCDVRLKAPVQEQGQACSLFRPCPRFKAFAVHRLLRCDDSASTGSSGRGAELWQVGSQVLMVGTSTASLDKRQTAPRLDAQVVRINDLKIDKIYF